jgi:hypothetical protein
LGALRVGYGDSLDKEEGGLLILLNKELEWPDLSMRGDKFDLRWRDVHGPTTTFQGLCILSIDTPTPAVVHDLVEHDQPNH